MEFYIQLLLSPTSHFISQHPTFFLALFCLALFVCDSLFTVHFQSLIMSDSIERINMLMESMQLLQLENENLGEPNKNSKLVLRWN